MFTGIIEELGEVTAWEPIADAARITVRAPLAVSDAGHGDSIAVNGVCLTVVDQGPDWFTADVMAESIRMTTLADIAPGSRVNIERAAAVDSRLGGHIVQGHVDATGTVMSVTPGERWSVVRISLPTEIEALVAAKGSIAVDGISLTVSAVSEPSAADPWLEVSLIPETLTATTMGAARPGTPVNLESDILARHVQRLLAVSTGSEEGGLR